MFKLNRKSRRNNARIMRIALRYAVRKGYDFCKVPTNMNAATFFLP